LNIPFHSPPLHALRRFAERKGNRLTEKPLCGLTLVREVGIGAGEVEEPLFFFSRGFSFQLQFSSQFLVLLLGGQTYFQLPVDPKLGLGDLAVI